ncbi:MAG: hypothetical protein R3E57_00145 [Porticoccaceae bacterium]
MSKGGFEFNRLGSKSFFRIYILEPTFLVLIAAFLIGALGCIFLLLNDWKFTDAFMYSFLITGVGGFLSAIVYVFPSIILFVRCSWRKGKT